MKTKVSQDDAKSMTIGQRLRQAREKLGLSHQEVTEHLCLKNSTILDIVEDSISTDLALNFVQGYILSYAKLVHVSEDERLILSELKSQRIVKVTPIQTFF